ncbi:hypothetical protein GCM10027026_38010 [Myroides odoratimimus subsp. xuanwuensis]
MAQKEEAEKTDKAAGKKKRGKRDLSPDGVRSALAQLAWLVCVVCALFLAVGALCIALGANEDNTLVAFVLDGADLVDLGIFAREDGVKEFTGENAETLNALVNWGIGAVAWLVIGKLFDKLLRP